MASLAAKGASVTAREDLFWPTTGTGLVDVKDAAGATVATGLSATYDAQTTKWVVSLTAAHSAAPGLLTLTWTHSAGSTATSTVDVRNGNPFPLAALSRALARGNGVYTLADKQEAAQAAVLSLEDALGTPLVTQRATVQLSGTGTVFISPLALCQGIVSPAGASVSAGGVVTFDASQTNPSVVVDHGYQALDDEAARAVALLASSRLADGPWDDRGMAITGDGGMMRLMTQGSGATHFSIPEVQEFYRRRRMVVVG